MRISEQESYRMTDAVKRGWNSNKNKQDSADGQSDVDTSVYDFEDQELVEEKVVAVWKAFSDEVKKRDEQSLYVTLSSETPKLKDGMIEFQVANQYQKEFIENIKLELLRFLRTQLQNKKVLIELKIQESNHKFIKALSPKEQYEQMVEKNPILHELRIKLDLDLSH